ncbi:DUF3737 family protein [Sharpea azabuensis]|uniref:DUF3737 domain-containing protein n=2 Tax=Sharpea TaxID=519427 RepID=A0A1H6Y8U5_9FIRM|nr:DUF3737 family protein [Sharpea azabuensis]SEJ35457.1 Protein of unknown function [Sharpea azabuensis]
MEVIEQKYLTGERALFKSQNIKVKNSVFADGESPLKESNDIEVQGSIFKWKYPLWYCHDIKVKDSTLLETARSGIWYTHNIDIKDSTIEAPKTFRRSSHIHLNNVNLPLAQETLWNCHDIHLNNVTARGDYFGFNSEHIRINSFRLTGNYCFDGGRDIEVHNAHLISKDAFWNTKNVTVYDSTIIGEYLGWNAENLTFVNCTIESLQGLCYIKNVKLVNCKLINTTLAFEYCENIDADIQSHVDSIMNPISGTIKAKSIGEVIVEEDKVNPEQTQIITTESIALNTHHADLRNMPQMSKN